MRFCIVRVDAGYWIRTTVKVAIVASAAASVIIFCSNVRFAFIPCMRLNPVNIDLLTSISRLCR